MILLKPLQIKAGGAYGSIKTAKKKIIFDHLKKKKKKKKKRQNVHLTVYLWQVSDLGLLSRQHGSPFNKFNTIMSGYLV